MKTIHSFATLALAVASMILFTNNLSAQELTINLNTEKSDSLDFVRESSNSHPGGWNFDIIGVNVQTKKSSSSRLLPTITLFGGWGFGLTNALNAPEGMGHPFNFCIEDMIALRMHPWKTGTLSLGAGIDVKNYCMTNNKRFVEDITTKQIGIEDYPEGAVPGYSKIHTCSGTFNLKYIQNLGRGFRLAFGPELSVVSHRGGKHKIENHYETTNGKQKEIFKNIKTNKVGFNLVGVINYKNLVGVYAKYSPTSVLNTTFGPEFQTLSVGIMLMGL